MTTPSSNSIEAFKNGFNGGTRANRFAVSLLNAFPSGTFAVDKPNDSESFKIYAASLPSAELGTIQVPYRGRILNIAGDRNYATWTIGIYDDNNSDNLWRSFQHWKERLDGHRTHQVGGSTAIDIFDFKGLQKDWTVHQLPLNGDTPIRTFVLKNCWPELITQINLDMTAGGFVKFTVNMVYDYYEITKGLGA